MQINKLTPGLYGTNPQLEETKTQEILAPSRANVRDNETTFDIKFYKEIIKGLHFGECPKMLDNKDIVRLARLVVLADTFHDKVLIYRETCDKFNKLNTGKTVSKESISYIKFVPRFPRQSKDFDVKRQNWKRHFVSCINRNHTQVDRYINVYKKNIRNLELETTKIQNQINIVLELKLSNIGCSEHIQDSELNDFSKLFTNLVNSFQFFPLPVLDFSYNVQALQDEKII